ncbi:MAG: PIG-L deacetylase family protein [Candidatus Electrothrix sp. YB6]
MFIASYPNELKVLALGAHPDDIEIGAGGFLAKLRREVRAEIYFGIMTYGQPYSPDPLINTRADEAKKAACTLLELELSESKDYIRFAYLRDCELHKNVHKLIEVIEQWIKEIKPDLILTHASGDLHDDHRQVFYATLSAARDFHGDILLYQAPSTVPNEFAPNFYVEISEEGFQKKIEAINMHSSQHGKRFMEQGYSDSISEAWAAFHRLPPQTKLEAFKIYQSFLMAD